MVILPDVRGLHNFYCALARRFAAVGIDAIAIDYFGRTSPDVSSRGEDFDWKTEIGKVSFDDVALDANAAAAHLRGLEGIGRVFTMGFCFGGAMSWRQSAAIEGLTGAIGFYGVPERARDVLPRMKAPLLLLVAGSDFTPQEEFDKFDGELSEGGVPHKMVVYDGAPHSFFDHAYDKWKDACSDAWRQIFAFIERPN
jgi:carboxymethylenebutenolidase